ncbi:MAG: flagellar biosynthesis protein FlhA [Pseudomonadota bacterium]
MLGRLIENNKDLFLVLSMVLILVVLFSPIPPVILDLAIIINFGFALTILLMTFYVKKPVDFSTFPSLLLISTLFRLSLNIAATRLILTGGEAGEVIGSIGSFAVSGNFIVGLVVFFILVVVQFVVVTSGAQRVSEVAARFTLDSMPGQQMSIDADLNMGLIDQKEALRRREELEKEASFYGSMDGASKFVKGDAIAGVIILLIDIIAGWIIGVAQLGMSWETALQHFSLLTIGDGIATQIPALIISVATGIIVTRSSNDRELGQEVFKQLASVKRIPVIVACILAVLMLLPGMPKWPILIIIMLLGLAWWRMRLVTSIDNAEADLSEEQSDDSLTTIAPPIEIALGSRLSQSWAGQEDVLKQRLEAARKTHKQTFGIAFPGVRIIDDETLPALSYALRLHGTRYGRGSIEPNAVLAIQSERSQHVLSGTMTEDPVFRLPAIWIAENEIEAAEAAHWSVIDPIALVTTHLTKILTDECAALISRAMTVELIDEVRDRQSGLVEELIPNHLSVSDVQQILRNLLSEGVSIANIDFIFEALIDLSKTEKNPTLITEMLRRKMSVMICNKLQDQNDDLAVISLDPKLENQITQRLQQAASPDMIVVDPNMAQSLVSKISQTAAKMIQDGRNPVLLCGDTIRRQMRSLTRRSVPQLSVLAVSEIPMTINLKSYDVVAPDKEAQ